MIQDHISMISFILLIISDVLLTISSAGHTKTFYEVIVGTTTKASADASMRAYFASLRRKKKNRKKGSDYVDIFYDDAESVIEERKKKESEGGEDYGEISTERINIRQADEAVLDLVIDSGEYEQLFIDEPGQDYNQNATDKQTSNTQGKHKGGNGKGKGGSKKRKGGTWKRKKKNKGKSVKQKGKGGQRKEKGAEKYEGGKGNGTVDKELEN